MSLLTRIAVCELGCKKEAQVHRGPSSLAQPRSEKDEAVVVEALVHGSFNRHGVHWSRLALGSCHSAARGQHLDGRMAKAANSSSIHSALGV
jgi:hypothetical protein